MDISLDLFLKKKLSISYQYQKYRILFDVSKEVFLEHIEFFYHFLLYPLYLHRKEVELVSFPFPDKQIEIDFTYLHTNIDSIFFYLYLEAFLSLTKKETLPPMKKGNYPSFNTEQKRAIRRIFGPVCLLAPAGSGKTKTLVARITHLLYQGISEKHILVLVFNKKAEEEIKERLNNPSLEVRTFHSFCYQIIKENTNYELYTEDSSLFTRSLLEEIVMREKVVFQKEKDVMIPYIKMLARVESELVSRDEMYFDLNHEKVDFYPIFQSYLKLIEREEMMSFDDLLYLALCLILKDGALRFRLQKQYQYILVDEFQDLNQVQLLLIRILALPENHLFVVGDDDQTIYGFRGANVSSILNFKKMYPKSYQLTLKWNYRSGVRLVEHAREFIDHNFTRVGKDFSSYQKELGDVSVFISHNFQEEGNALLRWLEGKENVAILYRYKEYGMFLQFFFMANGYEVEYSISFAKEFSLLYTLLSCLLNSFIEKRARILCEKLHLPYPNGVMNESEFFSKLGDRFLTVYETLQNKDISFRTFCFLLRMKEEDFLPKYVQNEEYTRSFLNSFISFFGGVKGLYSFLKRRRKGRKRCDVVFATIHQVKGMEYDSVCYFHMEKPKDLSYLEEERRVSYVAMTRARKNLLITASSIDIDYLKEYFCFRKLQDVSDRELDFKIDSLKEELDSLNQKILLLQKDQDYLKEKFQYEVRDDGLQYFCNQFSALQTLFIKKEKIGHDLFYYQEEKNARCLVFPRKK